MIIRGQEAEEKKGLKMSLSCIWEYQVREVSNASTFWVSGCLYAGVHSGTLPDDYLQHRQGPFSKRQALLEGLMHFCWDQCYGACIH